MTQKIVASACRIAKGSNEILSLGNIEIRRDWGWAPEYVMAMMLMLQKQEPSDYVIATGQSSSLAEFIAEAFDAVGLNWQDFVRVDPNLMRPTDLAVGLGNPQKAKEQLGWQAKYRAKDVVKMMVKANFERN